MTSMINLQASVTSKSPLNIKSTPRHASSTRLSAPYQTRGLTSALLWVKLTGVVRFSGGFVTQTKFNLGNLWCIYQSCEFSRPLESPGMPTTERAVFKFVCSLTVSFTKVGPKHCMRRREVGRPAPPLGRSESTFVNLDQANQAVPEQKSLRIPDRLVRSTRPRLATFQLPKSVWNQMCGPERYSALETRLWEDV